MPRMRRVTKRSDSLVVHESPFRFCPIHKNRVFTVICEKKCEEKNCPIVRKRMDVELAKKIKAMEKRRRKKIEKEQKSLDELGETRNLLLKPEDRNDGED